MPSSGKPLSRTAVRSSDTDGSESIKSDDELRNEQTMRRLSFHPLNAEGVVRAKRILSMLAIQAIC